VTRLRRMMLEELERRNYSSGTIRYYVRFVERFAEHFGRSPDKLGPDHVRTYQSYLLKQRKLSPGTVEHHISALRFLYGQTLPRYEFRIAILTTFSPARLGAICRRKPRDRTANIPPTSSSQRPASPDALHSKREYLSDTLQAICLHQPIMQSKSKPCISTAFHTTLRALAPFSGKSHFDCLRNLRKSFHKLNVRPSLMRRHICSDPPLQLYESRIFTQKRGGRG
jgi:hypothetical protein